MKILVTGGMGYIGSFVTSKLLELGHEVSVLDNLTYGTTVLNSFVGRENFKFVYGDVGDLRAVAKAVKGQEAVIALAAIVGDPACNLDENETVKTNFLATKILADVCEQYNVGRLVFASSCSVYGDTKDKIADESFTPNPLSLYAKTRVMSEQVLLADNRPLSPVILRLATVFGASKRMRFDLVVNLLTAMAKKHGRFTVFGGNQWRPNVHVQDAADAFIHAALIPEKKLKQRVFNVGDETTNLTIGQIGEMVRGAVFGSELIIEEENIDKRNYRVAFGRLHTILGFECKRSVEAGVREVADLFDAQTIQDFEDDVFYNVKYLTNLKKRVLVITPVYNESEAVDKFIDEVAGCLADNYDVRFLMVDDGSSDNTSRKILSRKKRGVSLKLIKLKRNFGQHAAQFAAFDNIIEKEVDFAVLLDVDLQNPARYIPKMLETLKEEQYDIVYGMRRKTSIGNGFLSKLFWIAINLFGSIYIPRDQSSLKVFNREFISRFKNLKNRMNFFPGALAQTPARIGYYFVETVPRTVGDSRYDILRKLKLFLFAFTSVVLRVNRSTTYEAGKIYE